VSPCPPTNPAHPLCAQLVTAAYRSLHARVDFAGISRLYDGNSESHLNGSLTMTAAARKTARTAVQPRAQLMRRYRPYLMLALSRLD